MTFRLSSRGQQITTCQLSRAHCFNKYAFIEAQLQPFIYSTIYGCSCPRGNNCNKGGVILQLKMFTIKVLSKKLHCYKKSSDPRCRNTDSGSALAVEDRKAFYDWKAWLTQVSFSFRVFTYHSAHSDPLLQYSRKRHPSQEGTLLLPPDTPSWCAILPQIYQPVKLLCLG